MRKIIMLAGAVVGLAAPSSAFAERWQFSGKGEGGFRLSFDLTGEPVRNGTRLLNARIVGIQFRNMTVHCTSGSPDEWEHWEPQRLRRVKVQDDGEFDGGVTWDSLNPVTQTYNHQTEDFVGQIERLSRATGAEGTLRSGRISGYWRYTDTNDNGHRCTTKRIRWTARAG